MSGFVYLWRDKKYNKYYIGSHWGDENDGYICSSKNMRENHRHRPYDFKRRVLFKVYSNHSDLLKEEQRWLDMIKPQEFGIKYYNINAKIGSWAWWMNEETKNQVKAKISQTIRNHPKKRSEASKKNWSNHKFKQKTSKAISLASLNNPKKSKAMKEVWKRFEYRQLQTLLLSGENNPSKRPEVRAKIKAKWQDPQFRARASKKTMTPKALLARANVGKWWNNGIINRRCQECPEGFVPGRF